MLILSILPEALHCSSRQVSSHLVKLVFYSSIFQSECCLNPFSLIRFLSRSNRSGFIVYPIPRAFDSCHSRRSSLLLECSRFFASSLEFWFHLIPFPFCLGPKISGRNLLLVEECCNAPDSMRQVSAPGVCQLFAVIAMSFACVLHFAMSSYAFHIMSSCALRCIRVRFLHPSIFPVVRFAIRHLYVLRHPLLPLFMCGC